MPTVAERVAKGAALQDEMEPGWAWRIDVGRLAMRSCTDCVRGQLHGDYRKGVAALWPLETQEDRKKLAWEHGFVGIKLDDLAGEYPALHAAWLAEIAKRKGAT